MEQVDQISQYKLLHSQDAQYGASSAKFIDEIAVMIDHLRPKRVLDYGCGKGSLLYAMAQRYPAIEFVGYDPAIPGRDMLPTGKFDFVVNTDVLEHIPESMVPSVLEKIASYSSNVYFNLHHALAKQVLPNGENAHCTVKPPEWYREILSEYFEHVTALKGRRDYLSVVVTFAATDQLLSEYSRVLAVVSRRPWWKRVLRKIAGRN